MHQSQINALCATLLPEKMHTIQRIFFHQPELAYNSLQVYKVLIYKLSLKPLVTTYKPFLSGD